MSKSQDRFETKIIGNLVSDPVLVANDRGEKVCYCKIATNPKAQRTDPKTGRELSDAERNKRRSFVELKITNTAAATKFHTLFKKGDRAEVDGVCGTRTDKKVFWSKKEKDWVTVVVDIDEDGQNCQEVYEERLMMWVADFSKVVIQDGCVTLVAQG